LFQDIWTDLLTRNSIQHSDFLFFPRRNFPTPPCRVFFPYIMHLLRRPSLSFPSDLLLFFPLPNSEADQSPCLFSLTRFPSQLLKLISFFHPLPGSPKGRFLFLEFFRFFVFPCLLLTYGHRRDASPLSISLISFFFFQ